MGELKYRTQTELMEKGQLTTELYHYLSHPHAKIACPTLHLGFI